MATMADSLVNSAMRPLKLRKRPDLEASRHLYHGRGYWVVKEPVGLNYFRFHEEEYAILNMLDGQTSMQEIRDRFQSQFAPQRITVQDLQQFIGMLHRSGLVISETSGQGRQLRRRGDNKKKRERLGKLANVFALRFRGIDPERILNFLLPWFGWLFTTWCIFVVLTFGLSALTLVFVEWDQFQTKLPTFQSFFAAHRWIWLGLTMGAVKVLHEFGHGLSCKKFGGECHEMGFMLLIFTPCLYCNVSDSWMLPNKWQRVFIGAAGMYVELILASFATFLWWFSEEGLFNYLCLSVMFICSVSTVVFNGNPLLRFDGYYILMDMIEIPNLRQKATEVLKRWFQKTCLGLELQDNPFLPHRYQFWFGSYTVAAVIYRWVVVVSIIFFLNQVLKPYGLQALGRAFAITGIVGLIAQPIWSTYKFFKTPGRASKMKRNRVLATTGVVLGAIGLVAFVPFPYHIDCVAEIQPADAFAVRSMVPGRLVSFNKKPGELVQPGEVIAQLENIDLMMQRESYQGEYGLTELKLQMQGQKANRDPNQASAVVSAESQARSAKEHLDIAEEKLKNLLIVSQMPGIIIEPPAKDGGKMAEATDQLPTWSGSPFEPKNEHAFFAEGDLLCYVGDPATMEAIVIIDQSDMQDLRVELGEQARQKRIEPDKSPQVEIMLESARLNSLYGRLIEIADSEMKESPQSLASASGGTLDTKMDPKTGKVMPISASYQAKVKLDEGKIPFRSGYRGQAKIHLKWKTLGWRLYRILSKTFSFEF